MMTVPQQQPFFGHVFVLRGRMLKVAIPESILSSAVLALLQTDCSSSTQPNHWIVKMLIKKKVVNDYFAARRGRHPHSAKPASAVAADKPSKVKRGSKTVSSMGANGIPRSSALPIDSRVPPITGE